MEKGKEKLCGKCEAQLMITENTPDACVLCELGKGFNCSRHHANM